MSKNENLHKAKEKKNDEFYTQLSDIENELRHYKQHFRGKVVFCNCDDPYESNFFKYFAMNFNRLGLKKLIVTGYATSPVAGKELSLFEDEAGTPKNQPYAVYINEVTDLNGDGRIDLEDVKILLKEKRNYRRKLKGNIALDEKGMPIQITVEKPCFDEDGNPILDRKGNQKTKSVKQDLYYEAGDFRSDESITLLKQADIVVTNPPFSLFLNFLDVINLYEKKFIILGNRNSLGNNKVFDLFVNNKIWTGNSTTHHMLFSVPKRYALALMNDKKRKQGHGQSYSIINNSVFAEVNACWFTNLDIKKRHEFIDLYKEYNKEEYPKYDNYDAINVDKVSDIPIDYNDIIGVPITFLEKYNPEQFQIIKKANDNGTPKINSKNCYTRVLIRKRNPAL